MARMVKAAALAALLGVAVTACGSNGGSQRPSSAAASGGGRLVIGYGAPVAEQLLPAFAQDQGIFRSRGLDVEVKQLHNATVVIPGLRSGQINFDVMASPQPEEGAAAGVQLKWLAMWNSKPDVQICAQPGIGSVQDLAGKSVGMSSKGSTTGVLLQDYLRRAGLDPHKVRLVPLGSEGAQAESFVSGQIAAFVCGPPVTQSVLAKRKGAKVLVDLSDKYTWNGAGLVGYMPWVQAHKQTAQKVVDALTEAWKRWKASPQAAQATIVRVAHVPAAAAKAAYEASLHVMAPKMAPSVSIERSVLGVLAGQLPNTKQLEPAAMVDPSFAR